MPQKILITEFMDDIAVAQLAAGFDVDYDPGLVDQPGELLARVAAVDALIVRNRTQVRDGLLAAASNLKVVGRLGVGLDNIDLQGCQARGIQLIPASGANAQAVAEYVLATAMLLRRGAYASSGEVAVGQWPRQALSQGREIHGACLGLIGFGSIGRLTARLATALGLQVMAHDPYLAANDPVWGNSGVQPVELPRLLAQADIISLHLPLTPAIRYLLDEGALARIKRGAVLINTARGGIIDETALAAALQSGQLAAAALDVFEQEPLPAGSPLAAAPNLLLTPHIAGVTQESNRRVSALIADAVSRALREKGESDGGH
jgi:(S)-sulfolactate dehydrogenase